MTFCARYLSLRPVGGMYVSTSEVCVVIVLKAERILSSAVFCTDLSVLKCVFVFPGIVSDG